MSRQCPILLAIVLTAAWPAACAPERRETVTIGDEVFRLELAQTPEEHSRGLMHRTEVPVDGGMLFVFPDEADRQFWMAYTRVDLDLLFLDARGRIVAIHEMHAEPKQAPGEPDEAYFDRLSRYPSGKPAKYAIELKAGTLGLLKVKLGDTVPLELTDAAP